MLTKPGIRWLRHKKNASNVDITVEWKESLGGKSLLFWNLMSPFYLGT
jgi:hypothetical protein